MTKRAPPVGEDSTQVSPFMRRTCSATNARPNSGPGPGAPPARGRSPVEAIEDLGPLDGADTRAGIFYGDLDGGMGSVLRLLRPARLVPPLTPVVRLVPRLRGRHSLPLPPAPFADACEEPSGPTVMTEITVAPPP